MLSRTLAVAFLLFNVANALSIGERSYVLVPRAYRKRQKRTTAFIIAFSLLAAAVVASMVFWLVRRYRKGDMARSSSPGSKRPVVAQEGPNNRWFGQAGLSGK
ncbi:hypothetical protein C7974DRAFT_397813 [Boeremia exigua]|uniref:uncharacterized protein n=1 Tax=Boeremia exigua TaxID=749465 RepID=UPI001E8E9338|nr:uncharacterized protein C7974DRAFT_397813 [Boeremia exigua]KAH6622188.1 hypothetical protein C7974DRAFT_397813 [Boeremia exigua]